MKQELSGESPRVLLAGASGYIGRAVLAELQQRGFGLVALVRPGASPAAALDGVRYIETPLTDRNALMTALRDVPFDTVVSCIASRSGVSTDAWAVDHDANQSLLSAALAGGATHFMLLSAICVQKPRLAFQQAKLAFEQALAASSLRSTIVRPTAYFKSLAGQVERVRQGRPFLIFGDGRLTACKPISEADLARFMVDRMLDSGFQTRVLPIGGPGPAISPLEQGELLFEAFGRVPEFKRVPPGLLAGAARLLRPFGVLSGTLRDKAELARIGHYYATESMLVWDRSESRYRADLTPETGKDTLQAFYRRMVSDGTGGQELGAQRLFRRAKPRSEVPAGRRERP